MAVGVVFTLVIAILCVSNAYVFPEDGIKFQRDIRGYTLVRFEVMLDDESGKFNHGFLDIHNDIYILTNDSIYFTVAPYTRLFSMRKATEYFSFQDISFDIDELNLMIEYYLTTTTETNEILQKFEFLDNFLFPTILNHSLTTESQFICDTNRQVDDRYSPEMYCCHQNGECAITNPNSQYDVARLLLQYIFRFIAAIIGVLFLTNLAQYYDGTVPKEELIYVTDGFFIPAFFLIWPIKNFTGFFYKNKRNWITFYIIIVFIGLFGLHLIHIATPSSFPTNAERKKFPIFIGFFENNGWITAGVSFLSFPIAIISMCVQFFFKKIEISDLYSNRSEKKNGFFIEYLIKSGLVIIISVTGSILLFLVFYFTNVISSRNYFFMIFSIVLCFFSFVLFFTSFFSGVRDFFGIKKKKKKLNLMSLLLYFYLPTLFFDALFFLSNFIIIYFAMTVITRAVWTYLLMFILDISQLQYYIFLVTIFASCVKFLVDLNAPFSLVKTLMVEQCKAKKWNDIKTHNKTHMDYKQKRIELRYFTNEVVYYCVPIKWIDFVRIADRSGVNYKITKNIIVFCLQTFVLVLFYFGSSSFHFGQDLLVQVAITSLMPLIPRLVSTFGGEETEMEKAMFNLKLNWAITFFIYASAPPLRADGCRPVLTLLIPKVSKRNEFQKNKTLEKYEDDYFKTNEWMEFKKRKEEQEEIELFDIIEKKNS